MVLSNQPSFFQVFRKIKFWEMISNETFFIVIDLIELFQMSYQPSQSVQQFSIDETFILLETPTPQPPIQL